MTSASPQPSLLCNAFAMFSFGILHARSFLVIAGAFQTLPEFVSLPQHSLAFPDTPQLSLKFLLLCWSCCVFTRVAATAPGLLLHHRSCCYFLRASFPWNSLEILHKASPIFPELSYYLLWCCYCIIASQFRSFTSRLCQRSP